MRESLESYCKRMELERLLEQWDAQRNLPLTPAQISYGSKRKVWWRCAEGHVWKAAIYSRAGKQRRGCPVCAGVVNGKRRERYEKMLTEVREVMEV